MSGAYCDFRAEGDAWRCAICGFVAGPAELPPRRHCVPRPPNKTARRAKPRRFTTAAEVCRHRGEQTRTVKCGLCGARELDVPVFRCARFGECTPRLARPRGERALSCCVGCSSFAARPAIDQILFGITAFDRPAHLERLVDSILSRYPQAQILVADNGRRRATLPAQVRTLELPFDCGLSAARNALVERLDRPYLLLLEEDFVFTRATVVERFVEILAHDPQLGMVAGALSIAGQRRHYAVDLDNFRGQLSGHATRSPWHFTTDGTPYRCCDKVYNFGLLRREFLADHPWDETLKVGEHAAFFYQVKQAGLWRVAFTPAVVAEHDLENRDEPYRAYRARARAMQRAWFAEHGLPGGYVQDDELHNQTPPRERPNVVVLGVGHSGTTILARMLHTAGWQAADADAEFAESVSIRRLNETLSRLGQIDGAIARETLARLPTPWAIKDPRLVKTLDRWLSWLAPYEPLLIWIRRETSEVVESYRRRGESAGDTVEKVEQLVSAAREQFDAWPWGRIVVEYERICDAVEMFKHGGVAVSDQLSAVSQAKS